jgi:hypothetical protein
MMTYTWTISLTDQLPFTSLQFPLYEALKGQLSKRYLDGKRPSPGQAAICGSIAGGFAGAVTCPLDVVKTRVMLEAKVRHIFNSFGQTANSDRRQCQQQMEHVHPANLLHQSYHLVHV